MEPMNRSQEVKLVSFSKEIIVADRTSEDESIVGHELFIANRSQEAKSTGFSKEMTATNKTRAFQDKPTVMHQIGITNNLSGSNFLFCIQIKLPMTQSWTQLHLHFNVYRRSEYTKCKITAVWDLFCKFLEMSIIYFVRGRTWTTKKAGYAYCLLVYFYIFVIIFLEYHCQTSEAFSLC